MRYVLVGTRRTEPDCDNDQRARGEHEWAVGGCIQVTGYQFAVGLPYPLPCKKVAPRDKCKRCAGYVTDHRIGTEQLRALVLIAGQLTAKSKMRNVVQGDECPTEDSPDT